MRFPRQRGSTSVMVPIFVPDNSVTTGAGLSGLTNGSTNLTIEYRRELDATFTSYTGANIEAQTTIGAFQAPSSSAKIRFKETARGTYELQFHDSASAFGSGDLSQYVHINIYEASTTALHIGPCGVLIPLVPWNYQDGVRMGLTALPNAAAAAANGLPTFGTGTGQINPSGGKIPATIATGDGTDAAAIKTTIGVAGAGLTALGDARLADLDAPVSTRSVYAGGAVASVTGAVGSVTAGVVVTTNNDKTGYSLSASGLNSIPIADPGNIASQDTFPKRMNALWRRFFGKATVTSTALLTIADDGTTTNTTQVLSDDGTTQIQGKAT